jgi:hypothetical protein
MLHWERYAHGFSPDSYTADSTVDPVRIADNSLITKSYIALWGHQPIPIEAGLLIEGSPCPALAVGRKPAVLAVELTGAFI